MVAGGFGGEDRVGEGEVLDLKRWFVFYSWVNGRDGGGDGGEGEGGIYICSILWDSGRFFGLGWGGCVFGFLLEG